MIVPNSINYASTPLTARTGQTRNVDCYSQYTGGGVYTCMPSGIFQGAPCIGKDFSVIRLSYTFQIDFCMMS